MASRWSALRLAFKKKPPCSKAISQRSFITLSAETLVDEETLPHYDPEQFYPVHIGDVFKKRYQVTGKLGYGAYSTSWLCRDLRCVTPWVSFLKRNVPINVTQKSKACRAKGVYFAAEVPFRNRSRVQDLRASRENQLGTPRTIIDPRAVRLIRAPGACWQAPVPRPSANAHDAPRDDETEPKTIRFTPPQNDLTTAIIGARFFAHRSRHYSHWC